MFERAGYETQRIIPDVGKRQGAYLLGTGNFPLALDPPQYGPTWLCFPVTYLALSASISAASEIVARHKGQHTPPNESFGFAMLGLGAVCAVACVGHWLTLAMLQRRLRNASRRALAMISSASAIITFAALPVFSAIGERQPVKLWTDLVIYWEIGGAVLSTAFVVAVWTLTRRPITQQITTG